MILQTLFPIDDLKRTIMRFPLSALCSALFSALLILNLHDVIDLGANDSLLGRWLGSFVYGFFWFGAVRLYAEQRLASPITATLGALLGYGAFVAYIFWQDTQVLEWQMPLLIVVLVASIGVAPFIRNGRKDDDLAFWRFNHDVWQGAALAVIISVLWAAGAAATLASLKYLFGLDIDNNLYGDIWALATGIFAPLYALSRVPLYIEDKPFDPQSVKPLRFVVNWVLTPLLLIYTAILYAYFLKIAIMQDMPRGQLSYMVMGFGGVGVATYLMAWPMRENGLAAVKLFNKIFFPALVLPVIMQVFALWMRVDQYGVTEQRYLVGMSALWLGAIALWYSFKAPPLKSMLWLLIGLVLVSAFGPLNAPRIAVQSQIARLDAVLLKNEIIVDGEIQKASKDISFDDRKTISSVLSFLSRRDAEDYIAFWPKGEGDRHHMSAYDLTKEMGFNYVSGYQKQQTLKDKYITLQGQRIDKAVYVRGYDLYVNNMHMRGHSKPQRVKRSSALGDAVFEDNQGVLTISLGEQNTVTFNVSDYAIAQVTENAERTPRRLVLEKQSGQFNVKLLFNRISLNNEGGAPTLSSYSFESLIAVR